MDQAKKVGNLVRRLRKEEGKTQDELAQELYISQSKLSRVENGERKLTLDEQERAYKVLPVESRSKLRYNKSEKKSFSDRLDEMSVPQSATLSISVGVGVFMLLALLFRLYDILNFQNKQQFLLSTAFAGLYVTCVLFATLVTRFSTSVFFMISGLTLIGCMYPYWIGVLASGALIVLGLCGYYSAPIFSSKNY